MPPSEVIEKAIREKADKLDAFYDHIMSCRVLVEAPHRHHRKGKLYHVRIDLTLPGGEIVVKHEPKRLTDTPARVQGAPEVMVSETHEPGKYAAHRDIYVAIRDAFDAARRRLQDYARRRRGTTKLHSPPTHGRVTKLFPEEGFGFIETREGREIYFHKNSVLEPGFTSLKLGSAVYFAEEEGDKGYQASTVKLAGKHTLL
jgi:cold shock CspA family protein/ribosome-associated translation inhibitor RaiA